MKVLSWYLGCPDHPVDVDTRTWTCRTCRQSVLIDMADDAGNDFQVDWCSASQICEGDFLVYQVPSGLAAGQIVSSGPSKGKGKSWYLTVLQYRGLPIDGNQYVNRIAL